MYCCQSGTSSHSIPTLQLLFANMFSDILWTIACHTSFFLSVVFLEATRTLRTSDPRCFFKPSAQGFSFMNANVPSGSFILGEVGLSLLFLVTSSLSSSVTSSAVPSSNGSIASTPTSVAYSSMNQSISSADVVRFSFMPLSNASRFNSTSILSATERT